ncbi:hypothetical protein A2U01_0068405 [Trifolium medium]|uniref:Uncharacterized protein n=1 Tax=Trifolium medium TaxID=97028 RepID=A0A392SG41_9FABA|nr:hypothetical protein [Trifolium medium]
MTALHESMYQLHLQGPVMTSPDFHAHNNWPGDRPHSGDRVGTSAGAEGDDDDVDNAAADAFEEEGDDDEMQDE